MLRRAQAHRSPWSNLPTKSTSIMHTLGSSGTTHFVLDPLRQGRCCHFSIALPSISWLSTSEDSIHSQQQRSLLQSSRKHLQPRKISLQMVFQPFACSKKLDLRGYQLSLLEYIQRQGLKRGLGLSDEQKVRRYPVLRHFGGFAGADLCLRDFDDSDIFQWILFLNSLHRSRTSS